MAVWDCCNLSVFASLIATLLVSLYIYGKRRQRILKECGFDGPEPTILVGSLLQMAKLGFVDSFHHFGKKYGKVYGLYNGGVLSITVTDLDILKEIFVKQFHNFTDRQVLELNQKEIESGILFARGAQWKRIRNMCTPTFSASKLKHMCGPINECAEILTENLMKSAQNNEVVTIKDFFGAFTMDTILITAFGMKVDAQNDKINTFAVNAKKVLTGDMSAQWPILLGMIFPSMVPFLRWCGGSLFPKKEVNYFVDTVKEMIAERKRLPPENQPSDFLQMLLNAEHDGTSESTDGQDSQTGKPSKVLTMDEITAQAFLFLIAAYDTTGSALTFTSYNLATHPEVQDKLIEEIDRIIGDDKPTYDKLSELKYLDFVLHESLRLYPPVYVVTRMAKETVTIKGYTFPQGACINIPSQLMHRDPELYPDPLSFKPERWERKAEMNPMTFLPFGFGQRQCIGMRLALTEAKMALIHVLRKIKFVRVQETPDSFEYVNSPTLLPKEPIRLGVTMRT